MIGSKFHSLAAAAALAVFTGTVCASENDITLNGDFRGAAVGAAAVPGWKISGEGTSRIVQGGDRDEFGLALTASAQQGRYASTDLIPVRGKYLEFEADVRGTGRAAVIINAFDSGRKALDLQAVIEHDPAGSTKFKFLCDVKAAEKGYITISLAALPGAEVVFEDVEAEFENGFAVGTRILAPAGSKESRLPAGINPAYSSTAAPAAKELLDDSFFTLKSVENEVYQISIPVGSDVEFELEESAVPAERWRIASSDINKSRVELKHDADGIWPFRTYKAEIEIEALAKGESRTVFTSPGRSFTVIVKAY